MWRVEEPRRLAPTKSPPVTRIIAVIVALFPGAGLGIYEVIPSIGEGGMGQVFRARDTRLARDVAIKILPEAFAGDADRLARFQREAKTLASLNHPHIATIYGFEEGGGVSALVMELVEGVTLAELISRRRWGPHATDTSGLPLEGGPSPSKLLTSAASSTGT